MTEIKTPKIGDWLKFKNYGLLIVHDRGIFNRGNCGSEYSIMKDLDGNIVKNSDGHNAWFYDDFLTEYNFKVK